MRYLKAFNENVSVFNSEEWVKLLPKELTIITNNGEFVLNKKGLDTEHGYPGVYNLMNNISFIYGQNTIESSGGDVGADGEPDNLQFDISMVKDNDGTHANPSKALRLNIDLTYGDSMMYEFTIDYPNKVNIHHYNGIGSKYDSESYFGFEDESIKSLCEFFNRFGFSLEVKDLAFMDKHVDSYVHQESIKLNPSFSDEYVLVLNNSKPQENRFLDNVLSYLTYRGIEYKLVTNPEDLNSLDNDKIIGAISTGSEYRINKPDSENEGSVSKKAFEILTCPIVALCYGMQLMAKENGAELVSGDDLVQSAYPLSDYKEHELFNGIDMENTKFSFAFHDYPSNCPEGFEVIANLDDKICAIANDSKKHYGLLFHPEDIEHTYPVLDNFMKMCKGKDYSDDFMGNQKVGIVESYTQFIKRKNK